MDSLPEWPPASKWPRLERRPAGGWAEGGLRCDATQAPKRRREDRSPPVTPDAPFDEKRVNPFATTPQRVQKAAPKGRPPRGAPPGPPSQVPLPFRTVPPLFLLPPDVWRHAAEAQPEFISAMATAFVTAQLQRLRELPAACAERAQTQHTIDALPAIISTFLDMAWRLAESQQGAGSAAPAPPAWGWAVPIDLSHAAGWVLPLSPAAGLP